MLSLPKQVSKRISGRIEDRRIWNRLTALGQRWSQSRVDAAKGTLIAEEAGEQAGRGAGRSALLDVADGLKWQASRNGEALEPIGGALLVKGNCSLDALVGNIARQALPGQVGQHSLDVVLLKLNGLILEPSLSVISVAAYACCDITKSAPANFGRPNDVQVFGCASATTNSLTGLLAGCGKHSWNLTTNSVLKGLSCGALRHLDGTLKIGVLVLTARQEAARKSRIQKSRALWVERRLLEEL